MDEAVMLVNLCPSSNNGKASCSVLCNGQEKPESEAVVNIDHTITSVCPVNGAIAVITKPQGQPTPLLLPSDANHSSIDSGDMQNERSRLSWSQENMTKAIDAVKNGMHVRAAARMFCIPRTTLTYKVIHRIVKRKNTEEISTQTSSINVTETECSSGIEATNQTTSDKEQHSQPMVSRKKSASVPLLPVITNQDIIKIPFIDKCLTLQNDEELLTTISSMKLKKPHKTWSEETMRQAVEAVMKGSKIRDASALFGVPHSTLGNRVVLHRKKMDNANTNIKNSKMPKKVNIANLYQPILPAPPKHKDVTQTQIASQTNSVAFTRETRHKHKLVKPVIKQRGKIKQWKEEAMKQALDALENEGISLNAAAKKYNVPKSTLDEKRRKLELLEGKGRRQDFTHQSFAGSDMIGSFQDEYPLVCYVNVCAMFGFTNIKSVVLLLASESAEKRGFWDIQKQGLLPDSWWKAFCLRHANLIKNVEVTSRKPVRLTKAHVSLFFDKLSALINRSNFHKAPLHHLDERLFTVEEIKFDMKMVNSLVNDGNVTTNTTFMSSTMPSNHSHQANSDYNSLPSSMNTNNISTLCCVSADGNSLPPMFVVFVEDEKSDEDFCKDDHYIVYKVKDKTRNSDFYFKWFSEVLLKCAPKIRPLILLLDPGSSFITPQFISLANQNEVLLLCLPPLSSHLTQPLNTTIRPALEEGFKSVKNNFAHGVNCCNFPQCFKSAWNSSVNADVIKSGFEITGIHPLNRNVFDHLPVPLV